MLSFIALAAASPAASPVPAAPATLQQRFEAATAAAATGRCANAILEFTALETTAAGRNPGVRGAILARKSGCLLIERRPSDAVSAAREAITLLTPGEDMMQAHLTLGRVSFSRHDYQAAAGSFRAARDTVAGVGQFEPLLWLARATLYDSGNEAVTAADNALALVTGDTEVDRINRNIVETVRGRILLNSGDLAGGYAILKAVNKAQGGLTAGKVSMSEVVTRSDLALAALLNDDENAAREALAYTGAGRFEKSPFGTAVNMDPPACGGEAELKPADFAIVEFAIRDDGSVSGAAPIYISAGGPAAAAAYAEAVDSWSWQPEDLAKIPAFFRTVTRVELRCSNAAEQPDVTDIVTARAEEWLKANSSWRPNEGGEVARAATARNALTKNPTGSDRLGPLITLGMSPLLERGERTRYLDEAAMVATQLNAPPVMLARLDLYRARLYEGGNWRSWRTAWPARIQTLMAKPAYAADPEIMATLRLAEAEARKINDASQAASLMSVAEDTRLPAESPLKQAALLRLSSVSAATGQLDQARSYYQRTGLDAQQCALLDMQPAMTKSGAGSVDFPMEAQRWGFEGWVKTEFDVAANGRTTNQRVVIAYPPLVFRNAGLGIAKNSRWETRFRPEGDQACTAKQQSVRFQMYSR